LDERELRLHQLVQTRNTSARLVHSLLDRLGHVDTIAAVTGPGRLGNRLGERKQPPRRAAEDAAVQPQTSNPGIHLGFFGSPPDHVEVGGAEQEVDAAAEAARRVATALDHLEAPADLRGAERVVAESLPQPQERLDPLHAPPRREPSRIARLVAEELLHRSLETAIEAKVKEVAGDQS